MKPQDIIFIIILIALVFWRRPKMLALTGLLFLSLSIPLFSRFVFFTAERLVMYAIGFIFVAIVLLLIQHKS